MTPMEPADYWKLRTVSAELERDQTALAAIQSRLEVARQKRQSLWMELSDKYKFDPTGNYTANDDACALVPSPNGGPPQT